MAYEIKRGWAFIILMLVWNLNLQQCVIGFPHVPCYFIFGDSLADNGNNNVLLTLTRSIYPPYGIDFPIGTTGRFCNGATHVDMIAKLLGFDDYIPPFALALAFDALKGFNYASGGAGILDETGRKTGVEISLSQQLRNHQQTIKRVIAKLGNADSANQYLNKCLYTVNMGSNDYLNNYFLPQFYSTSLHFNLEQYTQLLINQYSQQLKTLHNSGARKIALFGLGRLGCNPYAINVFPINITGCVEKLNYAAQLFNNKLKSLVDQLNANFPDAKFIYVNTYGIMAFGNAPLAGFTVLNKYCCEVVNINFLCIPNSIPCQNRNEYVFWDGFHPTQAANKIYAQRSYTALHSSDAYPFDISHLAKL